VVGERIERSIGKREDILQVFLPNRKEWEDGFSSVEQMGQTDVVVDWELELEEV
jgi:hypothetical protein